MYMKNILKLMLAVVLAFGMLACGGEKITQEDLKQAEATLLNDNPTIDETMATEVAEKYVKFVKQNPDDPTAPMWLFHAIEINERLKNSDKCIELGKKLLKQYPESEWAPRTLFYLGNYIYDAQLHDLDKAREAYERLISDYPNSELVGDAQKSIEFLGMTPEEILTKIMMSKMEEEEGEL